MKKILKFATILVKLITCFHEFLRICEKNSRNLLCFVVLCTRLKFSIEIKNPHITVYHIQKKTLCRQLKKIVKLFCKFRIRAKHVMNSFLVVSNLLYHTYLEPHERDVRKKCEKLAEKWSIQNKRLFHAVARK